MDDVTAHVKTITTMGFVGAVRAGHLVLSTSERTISFPIADARILADWILGEVLPPTDAEINQQQIERFRVALAERGLK